MILSPGITIAVVGLGYVGLPLAVEFGKQFKTIGYDLSETKIAAYRELKDPAGEISTENFKLATQLEYTTDPSDLTNADFIVIAVPTPVDEAHTPDFSILVRSSTVVGKYMKNNATVIYESTVYPGATEEICIPVLEQYSGMKWKKNFSVGYSPERVNPGDKERTITKIVKIVSGDTYETLERVAALYESIIVAGIYKASSIKVAEAAKVIENTQRDLNIALMNELAIIFDKIGIDTLEVIQAASTKWNFVPFRPGLVGGHCIGVDPYYLTHKAEISGYHPQVILAGRRINDSMAAYIAQQTLKQMINAGFNIKGAKVIVLGLTFKEDCSDLRNSKVADVILELQEFGCEIIVHDPLASLREAQTEYGITLKSWDELPKADAIVAAVAHEYYLVKPMKEVLSKLRNNGVFVDIKSRFDLEYIKKQGYVAWRL